MRFTSYPDFQCFVINHWRIYIKIRIQVLSMHHRKLLQSEQQHIAPHQEPVAGTSTASWKFVVVNDRPPAQILDNLLFRHDVIIQPRSDQCEAVVGQTATLATTE